MNQSEFTIIVKKVLKKPGKKKRRLIAIDETKIKENNQIFVWAAIDVDTKECCMGF